LKTKYIYFLIAALLVAVAAYPVVYASVSGYGSNPFGSNPTNCTPLLPCYKQPGGTIVCVTSCTIIMLDSSYSPGTINASVGATIHWINKDGFAHTVTSFNSSGFDSGIIPPGGNYVLTISKSFTIGSYYYHCNIHPDMIGLLNVISSNATS
jgi:hypothetical protein